MPHPAVLRTPRTIYQGDTYRFEVTLTDADGDALDVSTSTFAAALKIGTADAVALTVDDTDAASGGLVLSLTATETAALPAGSGHFDLEETLSTGDVRTLLRGPVTVYEDVTA